MSEKTLDELKAEMRKDVELILSGKHPVQKADGVMFVDGYGNCINESRRGLGKLPLVDPKVLAHDPYGSKRLLVVTIVNDEVTAAAVEWNKDWPAPGVDFTSLQVTAPTEVKANALLALSKMKKPLKLFLFIPVAVGEKVEMVYATSEEEAKAIHKEKVVDPAWCDVVTEIAIPTSPSYVDYQTRFDHDDE